MKVFDYTAVVWRETAGYVSKCPDEAMARIKLEEYVPGEVLQHIPTDRTTYWA